MKTFYQLSPRSPWRSSLQQNYRSFCYGFHRRRHAIDCPNFNQAAIFFLYISNRITWLHDFTLLPLVLGSGVAGVFVDIFLSLSATAKNLWEPDDLKCFSFFSRAAPELLHQAGKKLDIVHCHDWKIAFVGTTPVSDVAS
ncbi:hypothetical protein QVD17_06655 [Tagetes erecta]|uniref:starch synthase n=1 Tax=Tagetes erecta TaxID=13708 RepID=A0AAD8PBG1_TARER|nr:hypothetical protein QVD17_06655 [Tagetes erecta]